MDNVNNAGAQRTERAERVERVERVERLLCYRMFRAWALFDRENFRAKCIAGDEGSDLRHEQMQLLAFIAGNQDITPDVLANTDLTTSFEDLRKDILYPRLKEISKALRVCKRQKRRNKRRLKHYELNARALRSIFGDLASRVLEFV